MAPAASGSLSRMTTSRAVSPSAERTTPYPCGSGFCAGPNTSATPGSRSTARCSRSSASRRPAIPSEATSTSTGAVTPRTPEPARTSAPRCTWSYRGRPELKDRSNRIHSTGAAAPSRTTTPAARAIAAVRRADTSRTSPRTRWEDGALPPAEAAGRPGPQRPEQAAAEHGHQCRHQGQRHRQPDQRGERQRRTEGPEKLQVRGQQRDRAAGHGEPGHRHDRRLLPQRPHGGGPGPVAVVQLMPEGREEQDGVVGDDAEQQGDDHGPDWSGRAKPRAAASRPSSRFATR